jgi:hypothetical protein
MRLESILDDNKKKTLVDLMLKGQDVLIYSKRWGVEGLEQVRGVVLNISYGLLIDFRNELGQEEYRHFCGENRGIALITDVDEKTLYYKNTKVLDINAPVKDNQQKADILKAGAFYMYYEQLPKEIHF